MYLAYKRKPNQSTDRENNRVSGMPGLYRALMTFGVILLVGTVIFYLLTLITLNLNKPSPVIESLIIILKNLWYDTWYSIGNDNSILLRNEGSRICCRKSSGSWRKGKH